MNELLDLTIYGNVSWLLANNIKLLTLRMDTPKYAEHKKGQNILIRSGESEFNLGIIYNRQVKPLRDYSSAELMLDGYIGPEEAAEDLKQYKGYEKVTVNTPMLGLGFASSGHYESYLTEELRTELLGTDLDQAVRMSQFRGFFMPSYLWWAIIKCEDEGVKLTITKWHDFLTNHLQIISVEELKSVKSIDTSTAKFYRGLRHKSIKNILKYSPTYGPEYQSVVLCNPIPVKK